MEYMDYIINKAIFNEQLHNAIIDCDEKEVTNIIMTRYQNEMELGFFKIEPLDMNELKVKFVEQICEIISMSDEEFYNIF